jgi:hypothetical protein
VSSVKLGHRGRLLAAVVASVLALAAVVLAAVATIGQQHAPSPSASAAVPGRERTLGQPPSTGSTSSAAGTGIFGLLLPRSVPMRLDVPRIGIRGANLVRLGLRKDGSIQVPSVGRNSPAGWFENSPTPGQLGASVILGHVDTAISGPAIFYRLGTLRPGDTVRVTRADNTVAVFLVDSVEKYAKATFPTLKVFGDTNHAGLRLITCGGMFNRSKGGYQANIVVYAHLVSSHIASRTLVRNRSGNKTATRGARITNVHTFMQAMDRSTR